MILSARSSIQQNSGKIYAALFALLVVITYPLFADLKPAARQEQGHKVNCSSPPTAAIGRGSSLLILK